MQIITCPDGSLVITPVKAEDVTAIATATDASAAAISFNSAIASTASSRRPISLAIEMRFARWFARYSRYLVSAGPAALARF